MVSIDGLVSGLDTTSLVQQLMQLERAPQVRLANQQSQLKTTITGYQGLNTQFSLIGNAAEAAAEAATWTAARATSSDDARVGVTATPGAPAARLTVAVQQLATDQVSTSTATVSSPTDAAVTTTAITLTRGGSTTDLTLAGTSLADLVKAINDADAGVTASAVQDTPGSYRLVLTSTGTDTVSVTATADGSDPFTTALGPLTQTSAGTDAELLVGGPGGYLVTRSSNTVSDLLDGVTLTLKQADPSAAVTVEVGPDVDAITAKVDKMVSAANAALGEISRLTAYDAETGSAGVLMGDSLPRLLQLRIVDAVRGSGDGSAGAAGITVTRDGTLTFDKARFAEAYAADPAGVQAAIGAGTDSAPGLAARLDAVAGDATRSQSAEGGPGLITSALDSRNRQVQGLTDRIADYDRRLEMREQTLLRQFTAMETALSAAQQQSSWLSSQLAGLSTNWLGNS
jgi:flagellar hook-associated protein 2